MKRHLRRCTFAGKVIDFRKRQERVSPSVRYIRRKQATFKIAFGCIVDRYKRRTYVKAKSRIYSDIYRYFLLFKWRTKLEQAVVELKAKRIYKPGIQ